MNSMVTPQDVLDFWFGALGSSGYGKPHDVWFKKSDVFDQAVRARFLLVYELAADGRLAAWNVTPHALLALIIVCDQFPRNMFRNDPRTFATDAQALAAAQRMVELGWDMQLAPIARQFAYLPFEHAEDLATQQRGLELFARVTEDPALADAPEWVRKHLDVIARFGRFPHRNAILGRESTPEEIEFLKQPGSSF
jgi:uncharacterized protein (DUF924 family)